LSKSFNLKNHPLVMAILVNVKERIRASRFSSLDAKNWPGKNSLFYALFLSLLAGYVTGTVAAAAEVSPLVGQSTLLSHADTGKQISVVLVLPLKDATAARAFAEHVSKPGDPLYRKYLTPEQFASAYGASETDYRDVQQWAKSSGLQSGEESTSRTTLTVRGTIGQFEQLFNVQINNYRSPQGGEFYAASTAPVVPTAVTSKLLGVVGLSGGVQKAPLVKIGKKLGQEPAMVKSDVTGGTGPGGAYSPADLQTAYGIPSFGGTARQTVAVFEQGGFDASDIRRYEKEFSLPDVSLKFRSVDGATNIITDQNEELEAVLDIDMIIGINPSVKEVLVYGDGLDPFGVALLDALADVASDNRVQTLSISYGADEVLQGNTQIAAEGQLFVQLTAQGISVFASSGDEGAYGHTEGQSIASLNVIDPGAQPNVTSVGGTTLFLGPGSQWAYEEVWNELGSGGGATGGGVSSYWPLPAYQEPSGWETGNGGSATNRNLPDVAAVGDPVTGVAVYSFINDGWLVVGGTSVSAPIWAGYISQLNSATQTVGQGRVGFFNPTAYYFAEFNIGLFTDITNGSNGYPPYNNGVAGYYAGILYDNCSGWGSMPGLSLAEYILLEPAGTGTPPAAFGGLKGTAQSTTAQLSWSASTGATGYLVIVENATTGADIVQVCSGTQLAVSGLAPKTYYGVGVWALNNSGSVEVDSIIYLRTKK
jgi:subtilase family serine protease